jgi:hypothetical protein
VESATTVVRMSERVRKLAERYSPLDFHFAFVLFATNNEPGSIREA